jgi:hypothetical protein
MTAVYSELAQCTNSMQERDPARRPEASVTMWSSANASSQRRKPQELLSVPAGRISLRAGHHGRGTLLNQRDKARKGVTTGVHAFIGRVRLLRSALVRRNVHVHGLATAGAMTLDRRRSYCAIGALAGWR